MHINRRQFLEMMGATLAVSQLPACSLLDPNSPQRISSIKPTDVDNFIVAQGIDHKILVKWNDEIGKNKNGDKIYFGTNNDFTAYIPFQDSNPDDGILMVNHESCYPLFVSGYDETQNIKKTREQIAIEQKSVGISLLRLTKDMGQWNVNFQDSHNRRISAQDPIPFISFRDIDGSKQGMGTLANCAGGKTPWNTFLTCEENYDYFYGDYSYQTLHRKKNKNKRERVFPAKKLLWSLYEDQSPEHYGWVVEIHPTTGEAKKLTALGRFSHEGATCIRAKDGRVVVYMGDDANNECLYKFISEKKDSLHTGTLYVANLEKKSWLPLDISKNSELKKKFKDQTELLIRIREASKILGGSALDRPEDIEINPRNGDVLVALTNNIPAKNFYGSLLRIKEKDGDHGSLEFESDTFLTGGLESGLSCPDNMTFDKAGNLWVTNDINDERMNQGEYASFKNNGLFYIPMSGREAGKVFQIASAPRDAELTGPMFLPDNETLLLSVQHPGTETKNLNQLRSSWPNKKGEIPSSAVVALSGPTIKKLSHLGL